MHCSFASRTPGETQRAGALLAEHTGHPLVVCLIGDLGVGKTHFVKGLADGLGLDPEAVTSPTFAIVNEYEGHATRGLVHMDFYRLESESALEEVGFLDLLALDAILAIEWGDRFQEALPPDHLVIRIAREQAPIDPDPQTTEDERDDAARRFEARATGPASNALLETWCKALRTAGHEVNVSAPEEIQG